MEKTTSKEVFANMGNLLTVKALWSRSGKTQVANQIEARFAGGSAFYSYGTLIAVYCCGRLYLTDYHDYSNTTSKYCGEFCGMGVAERRKALANGSATLIIDC